jgi:Na+/phosphate symporter
METTVLQEKLASLPEEIQQQVVDYVDFLVQKYQNEVSPLTDAEKQTLEQRYQAYQHNPSKVEDLEKVKNRLLKKYELPG